jgi:nucleoid-associated protein YgaU
MADLEQLKQKYARVLAVFETMAPYGAKLDNIDLDGEKLHIKGEVPSTVVANHIWDEIKKADPSYSDLHHEIKTTGPGEQEYTVKAGDTLSAICLLFYGNANNTQQWPKPWESMRTSCLQGKL